MLPYYFLIVPIALMAFVTPIHRRTPFPWAIAYLVILVFVGLRHHVGMDWNNYLLMIYKVNLGDWWHSVNIVEPGYGTLLWISGQNGWGVYGAYFMGTIIFAAGLFRYANTTHSPWIALLVAIPILVIVVSMSAARQAVAIGVLLWLAAEWSRASLLKRTAFILVAMSFHASAICFLFFAFLDLRLPIWARAFGSALIVLMVFYILGVSGHGDYYNEKYGTGRGELTQSSGAIFHVALNGLPALVCFALGRSRGGRVRNILLPDKFHVQLAIVAISLIPLSFISSAAAGRLTLYLFPVSMWFFAAMPLLIRDPGYRSAVRGFFCLLFIGMLSLWLNSGNSASAHGNYRNALFVPFHELVLCCR